MNDKSFFDAEEYFSKLVETNICCIDNAFKFCTCSGIDSLQEPLQNFKRNRAFFCVDDTNDGAMFQGRSGGWYKKRTFTVFILHRYTFNDMSDRAKALAICRTVFRQICSRLLIDQDDYRNDMVFLHTDNILSRELGQYFMNGCTGLYFMIDVSEPVDLSYKKNEWLS